MTKQLFIKFAKDDTTYHLYGGDEFAQYGFPSFIAALQQCSAITVEHA
jgi:hypothetical protein